MVKERGNLMEFEGTVLQPNFREKEKRYRATIVEKENFISLLTGELAERAETITVLKTEIKELKDENLKVRQRFRNFRANAKDDQ